MGTGRGGGSSKTGYTSKGQRRNVARKVRNAIRRERRADPPLSDVFQRMDFRNEVINKPRGSKQRELQDRYVEEDRVEQQAGKLLEQYREVGLPKSAAVQAVKTNYIEQLHGKWGPRLKDFRESEKRNRKLG